MCWFSGVAYAKCWSYLIRYCISFCCPKLYFAPPITHLPGVKRLEGSWRSKEGPSLARWGLMSQRTLPTSWAFLLGDSKGGRSQTSVGRVLGSSPPPPVRQGLRPPPLSSKGNWDHLSLFTYLWLTDWILIKTHSHWNVISTRTSSLLIVELKAFSLFKYISRRPWTDG